MRISVHRGSLQFTLWSEPLWRLWREMGSDPARRAVHRPIALCERRRESTTAGELAPSLQ